MFSTKAILFIILGLSSRLHITSAQVCTGVEAGLDPPGPRTPHNHGNTDTFIMVDKGGISCMGVIKEWRFNIGIPLNCVRIKFQIWRPDPPGSRNAFILVGENDFNPTSDPQCNAPGEVVVRVPTREQIPVYPGDVIGWTETNPGDMLEYVTAPNPGDVLHGDCRPGLPGDTCSIITWTTLQQDFSLRAYIDTGPEPSFGNLPNYVNILEDEPLQTVIFTTTASHPADIQGVDTIMDGAVPLSFSIAAPMVAFSIGLVTPPQTPPNSVTWEAEIQTEILFDYQVQQQYLVDVVVEGLGVSATRVLTVNILDQNQPHVIDNLPASIMISAPNTMEDDEIYTVRVSDPSTANPLPIYYYIDDTACTDGGGTVTVASPFRIQSDTGIIYVNRDMADWNEADQCILDIVTTDYVNVVADELTVDIVDITNDITMTNVPGTASIPENVPGGSNVFQVTTDSPDPSTLHFAFTNVVPGTNSFEIHPTLGLITTSANPDFDVTGDVSYTLSVKVTDRLGNTDDGDLTVNIDWINKAPFYQPDVYTHSMPEECGDNCLPANIPWDTGLLVYVYDRDAENNLPLPPSAPDALTCSILPGFGEDKFRLGPPCIPGAAGITLYQTDRIDVDDEPEYSSINLTVRVEDRSGESDTAEIYIEVFDINDNAPIFSPINYAGEVDENTPGGVSVLTVTATDGDSGRNGEFTYSVSDGGVHPRGSVYFQVDPISGVVSTKHPADYENFTVVDFQVVAMDKGTPQRTGSCNVVININDVNDNRPYYDCSDKPLDDPYEAEPACFYSNELRDNTLVGHKPLNLSAFDVDTVTPDVTFYLLQPVEHFTLGANGSIIVSNNLHTYNKYVLYCMAQDNGDPNLLASPPAVARFDSFDRKKHLVDITLQISKENVNDTVLTGFIWELRKLLDPWVVKLDGNLTQVDRTTVTIYALEDNSTYLYANLDKTKHFVMRDPLLSKLRDNIFGDPNDDLTSPPFTPPYNPILVMPTYPNWWLDTLPGLITLTLLCLLALLLLIGIILYICKRNKLCCFKDKPPPTKHDWPEPDNDSVEMDDSSTIRIRSRQGSVDTVHTLIYDPNQNRPL